MTLKEFFRENPRAALGFSGGVDSAYLLYAALSYGADIRPYFIKTQFQPEFEYKDAVRLCEQLRVKLNVIEYDILTCDNVKKNPQNRCYHCKREMFSILAKHARSDGYSLLLDGTNASDNSADRPGMKALTELSVCSPLLECGITKSQIRTLSKQAGLFTWDKPAYACLATRIPCDTEITDSLLCRIEAAEGELFKLGFYDFRIRVFHQAARLQFKREQFKTAAEKRDEIISCITPYFKTIFLDTEVR